MAFVTSSRYHGSVAKAIGYVRVSTGEQPSSSVVQETRIRAYAAVLGSELVDVISEQASGATLLAKRQGGQWLLHRLQRGDAAQVIALKLDRVFRDAADALNQMAAWDRADVSLHLVDMGGQPLCTSSAMGKLVLTMTAAFAELERNLISERTAEALSQKKADGFVYGRVPLGYRRLGDALVEDRSELTTIRRIQELHTCGRNYTQIADELNETRIPTKRGGKWHPSTVRYILRNDLYKREEYSHMTQKA